MLFQSMLALASLVPFTWASLSPHCGFEPVAVPYSGLQYDYSGSKVMGCYRMVPIYKTTFKTIDSTEQREKVIQVPRKTSRLITKYRKVPKTIFVNKPYNKVIYDTEMVNKVIMVTVPIKKTIECKRKEYVKQYLPHFHVRGSLKRPCSKGFSSIGYAGGESLE